MFPYRASILSLSFQYGLAELVRVLTLAWFMINGAFKFK